MSKCAVHRSRGTNRHPPETGRRRRRTAPGGDRGSRHRDDQNNPGLKSRPSVSESTNTKAHAPASSRACFATSARVTETTVREIAFMIAVTSASRSFTLNEAASAAGTVSRPRLRRPREDHLARVPRARDEDAANHVNDAESQKNEDHQLCFAQSSRVLAPSLAQHLTSERFRIRRWRRVAKVGFDPIETEMPVAMNDVDCLSAARFVKCSNDR
ncbi:hypothetical protein ACVJA9_008169 [Bradyrhizobium diazoefficiens]